MDKEMTDSDFRKITEGTISKKALGNTQVRMVEESIDMIGALITVEIGIDEEKGHFQETIVVTGIEVQVIVD